MSTEPEVIDVEIVPLPSPLRLGTPKFVTALKEVETEVAALKITDESSAQVAVNLQTRLTQAGILLEQRRAQLKAPVIEQGKKIDALAKGPADRIEKAKQAVKAALTVYDTEQRRLAKEAEDRRQAELDRLEKIRADEQAKADEAARLKAEEAAKRAAATKVRSLKLESDVPPPPTETEKQIARVQAAPAVVVPKTIGVSWKVTLIPTITDASKVPDLFVVKTVNMAAVRATYCTGFKEDMPIPQCPGITFAIKREPVTR